MRHRNAPTYLNIVTILLITLISAKINVILHTIIAEPYTYLSAVWAGSEDPVWPHLVLVPLSTLAGIAVGAGILLDRPRFSETAHQFALWFLIVGVPLESLCTILLFVVDEQVSGAQQAELKVTEAKLGGAIKTAATANEQAAQAIERSKKLENDNLSLQAEVLALREKSMWRVFTNPQREQLKRLLLGHLHVPPTRFIFDSVVGNPEAKHFGDLLADALSDATGTVVDEPPGLSTCVQCVGLWVCVNENAARTTFQDGQTIRDALEKSGVDGAKFCTDPKNGMGDPSVVKMFAGPKE